VHGLTPIAAGNVLLAAVVAYQLGMLSFGPLDRVFDTRKWIAIGGTLAIIVLLAALAIPSAPPTWLSVGAIVAMGFFQASSTMVMTHGRGIFPDRLIGRGIATMNTSVMLGVAVMQTLSGMILGAFEPLAGGARTEIAYRSLFGFLTVILICAVAMYSRSEDIKPSHEMRQREQAKAA
jgi:MFS family permease